MTPTHSTAGGRTVNPHAFSNGEMARKYHFARNSCHKPMAERLIWQQGWDAEDKRQKERAASRAALAKTGGAA